MKEKKLRAWDRNLKGFAYIEFSENGKTFFTTPVMKCDGDNHSSFNSGLGVWEEYIGKKDKNNVEIYEGDIISYQFDHGRGNQNEILVVSWNSITTGFMPFVMGIDSIAVEVVGHIHQNIDLLKKG